MFDFPGDECYNKRIDDINQKGTTMKLRKIAAVSAAALMLTGCAAQEPHSLEIYAMNTLMSLTAYGDNAEEALNAISGRMNELEQELSVTIPDSDISHVNSADGQPLQICSDAQAIISRALEISRETDGALDITIYPVVRAWGFTTGEHRVPSPDELAELLSRTGYESVELSGGSVTLPAGYEIDLGALAKGYAGDCAAGILREYNVSSGILNLGGNVCAIGSKPDGSPWKIAVADPDDSMQYLGIITAQDEFVVTSGKYERCFTADDGKTYHHIIDPATGYPSENGVSAVTIVGKSGIECDALSTAMLVSGEERACDFWREHGGFEMLLVTDDGRVLLTPGLAERFTSKTARDVITISN